jgi:signal transduction histidine kinase
VTVLQADQRRLKQILVNLLGNAVKFTPEGGEVGLAISGDEKQRSVEFLVWDTGIGIAAEDLPRLFRDFVQLDARLARNYEGTGLGLALVRRLAELHGGQVRAESDGPGKGSRFTVSLPWEEAQKSPPILSAER